MREDLKTLQGWIDAITADMSRLQDHKRQGLSEAQVLEKLRSYIADWRKDFDAQFPKESGDS